MDLRQLKAFVTIAKINNFSKAAEMLGYSQSTVSTQIQTLEEILGTKLFERLGRKIFLTQEGNLFLPYAEQILKLALEASDVVKDDAGEPKGTLTVGSIESLFATRLPGLFESYHSLYPKVELILNLGTCNDNLQQLINNTMDVAFILDRKLNSPEFITEVLVYEPMVLLAAPHHHLASKGDVTPEHLKEECLILTPPSCNYRQILNSLLLEAQALPKTSMEFNSIQAIKKFTMSSLGLTLLPKTAVEQELINGQLVELSWFGTDFDFWTQLVYHKDKWLSPVMKSFINLTLKYFENK